MTPEQSAELAVDGVVVADDAVYVETSTDPRDLSVWAYQNVQWLHASGDEAGLLSLVARLRREAYEDGRRSAGDA